MVCEEKRNACRILYKKLRESQSLARSKKGEGNLIKL